MIEIWLDARMCDENRGVLMEWARANDLDPADIPTDAKVVIDDGRLTVDTIDRGPGGKAMLDPAEPNRVKRVPRTVPYSAPWPLVPGPAWMQRRES